MRTIALLLTLSIASVSQAAPWVPDTDPPFSYGNQPVYGERIVDLPEDGRAWHCIVFTSAQPNAREQAILSWFSYNHGLVKLARQTHFHHYTPRHSVWPRYYNATNPMIVTTPSVVLETSEGNIVARFSGTSSHLDSDDTLLRAMVACINSYKQNPGNCPNCPYRPQPQPYTPPYVPPYQPDPGPFGPRPIVVDVGPNGPNIGPAGESHTGVIVTVIAAVVVVGLGALFACGLAGIVAYCTRRNEQTV